MNLVAKDSTRAAGRQQTRGESKPRALALMTAENQERGRDPAQVTTAHYPSRIRRTSTSRPPAVFGQFRGGPAKKTAC